MLDSDKMFDKLKLYLRLYFLTGFPTSNDVCLIGKVDVEAKEICKKLWNIAAVVCDEIIFFVESKVPSTTEIFPHIDLKIFNWR